MKTTDCEKLRKTHVTNILQMAAAQWLVDGRLHYYAWLPCCWDLHKSS